MSTNAWCPFRSKALASGVYRWNVQYTNWVEHLSTHESDMPQFVTNENLPAPKARLYPYPPPPLTTSSIDTTLPLFLRILFYCHLPPFCLFRLPRQQKAVSRLAPLLNA